jgi:hypothetical protein
MKRQEILFKVTDGGSVLWLKDGLNRPRSKGGFGGCICKKAFRKITKFEGKLHRTCTYKLIIIPHRGGRYLYRYGWIGTIGKNRDNAPLRGVDLPVDRVFRAQFRIEEVKP